MNATAHWNELHNFTRVDWLKKRSKDASLKMDDHMNGLNILCIESN